MNGAGFTTVNESLDGTGHCQNGNPNINCNIYDGKDKVWLNGGPDGANLSDGTYLFAVVAPSGQGGNDNPNDGTPKNLSDQTLAPWTSGTNASPDGSTRPSGDLYTSRTFTVTAGTVSYSGPHLFDHNKIRLMPYDDTPNPGGVYIMAICQLNKPNEAPVYPVKPSDCKYDAFKIRPAGSTPEASLPTVSKDAAGTYDETFTWTIGKAVDKTLVKQVGGNVTFTYTVTVEHGVGSKSGYKVAGTITATNGNIADVTGVNITDALNIDATCTVTGGTGATLVAGENTFPYSCDVGKTAPTIESLDNTVTMAWPQQTLSPDGPLAAASSHYTVSGIGFALGQQIDESVNVTDTYKGTLGTVSVGDANPTSFTYTRTVPAPANGCKNYDNTATFTTNDLGVTSSDSKTVTVCGPERTGALTIGFWQNKNGQGIITAGASTSAGCTSGTWLRAYAPFQDLSATATCAAVATYVGKIITAANASGAAMNAMLKAQMLATALDVYFSTPSLGGSKIAVYNGGIAVPLGGVSIDLTKICTDLSCAAYQNVSSAFGGATSKTVNELLTYAAGQSNAGGSAWYGQVKATQELAKDTFDAINNEKAFAP